jgi:hypothetical protein
MNAKKLKRIAAAGVLCAGTMLVSNAHGAGFGGLDAEWWQWALSIPFATNPVADDTGEDCMVGQRGDLWFLAGSFGGTATRNCTIPDDKTILVPAINTFNADTPNHCGQDATSFTVQQLRDGITPFIDASTNLSVTVDGRRQRLTRVRSNVFEFALPAGNVFEAFGVPSCPAGIYSPVVADGWYALITPLQKGAHLLHVTATNGGFSVDVTYHLTVVPVKN